MLFFYFEYFGTASHFKKMGKVNKRAMKVHEVQPLSHEIKLRKMDEFPPPPPFYTPPPRLNRNILDLVVMSYDFPLPCP